MSKNELPDLLRRVHAELANAESLDPESKALLGVVANDLEKFQSHVSTARRLAAQFEAEHPSLAVALRQLTDAFGKAGI
ncbi:MAG TPA: DUF4404 family protein [Steroidobacteraceae bacterium]|nr:DUF4404 family protein [Steroidobacteraceae bacterium]HRX91153.1 DUF4404 family protein [Steroidobacteraceae bacterium]